jgi:hypothetical protein
LRGLALVTVAIAMPFVFLVVFFRVAIAAVTVLSIHKRLRPSVLDGLQLKISGLGAMKPEIGARPKQLPELAFKNRWHARNPQTFAGCATG